MWVSLDYHCMTLNLPMFWDICWCGEYIVCHKQINTNPEMLRKMASGACCCYYFLNNILYYVSEDLGRSTSRRYSHRPTRWQWPTRCLRNWLKGLLSYKLSALGLLLFLICVGAVWIWFAWPNIMVSFTNINPTQCGLVIAIWLMLLLCDYHQCQCNSTFTCQQTWIVASFFVM